MLSKTKSRTFRRIKKKTPSNNVVVHYEKRSPKKPHCAICGSILVGMGQKTPNQLKKLSKTQRRPERPFGGVLCSKCSRAKIKESARE